MAEQDRVTLCEYVWRHQLDHQLPRFQYDGTTPSRLIKAFGLWLTAHCLRQGIPVRDTPVIGKRWPEEHIYPTSVIAAELPGWLARQASQLTLVQKGNPHA